MTNPKTQKRVIAWLLAGLVIGGSISPPVYRHAHAAGGEAHDHGAHHGLRQVESHQHHGHSHPHHHATDHDDAMEAPTAHFHIALLGIELTLPAPGDSNSDPSEPGRDDLPGIVTVMDEYVTTASRCNLANHWVTKTTIRSIAFASSNRLLKHAQPTDASVLLCDTARHERSGVQNF